MGRLVFAGFILLFVAGKSSGLRIPLSVRNQDTARAEGVRWVEMTKGAPLPPDSISFPQTKVYVGRARHFNDILPAKVWPNSTATIKVCGKQITKPNFEVLTSAKPCFWQRLTNGENLPEDLVLVGHQNASKPLFVGFREGYNSYYPNTDFMYTFSLLGNDIDYLTRDNIKVLVCPTERVWVDVSAKEVPKNAIPAGKTTEGKDMFVARLKKECNIYPGRVIPEERIAKAWADGSTIEERYCQVLVGYPDQFSWTSITDDTFPDNAVVGSTNGSKLYYVAKHLSSNISTYITDLFMDGIEKYEILVESVKDVRPLSIVPPIMTYINENDYVYPLD